MEKTELALKDRGVLLERHVYESNKCKTVMDKGMEFIVVGNDNERYLEVVFLNISSSSSYYVYRNKVARKL